MLGCWQPANFHALRSGDPMTNQETTIEVQADFEHYVEATRASSKNSETCWPFIRPNCTRKRLRGRITTRGR
jgi:hypothetical protein